MLTPSLPRILPVIAIFLAMNLLTPVAPAARLAEASILDREFLLLYFTDGEVEFLDDASGPTAYGGHSHEPRLNWVTPHGEPLDVAAATSRKSWRLSSAEDERYGPDGLPPEDCHRKSKINGHAQLEWDAAADDWHNAYTHKHFIYLRLPHPLREGAAYTLTIAPETNTDRTEVELTFDSRHSRSEAIRVNLVGYLPQASLKAADLYHWMGDGGARDYSGFEGSRVYLFEPSTGESHPVGTVRLHQPSGADVSGHNFTQSPVWTADFGSFDRPGTYRLVIEGVGCSPDFEIREDVYRDPFRVSTLGFFYMRIGADGMHLTPVPRRPLWIPGMDPEDCRVLITDMHPWRPEWPGGGDRWDQPRFFAQFVLPGEPENPNAYGGHSDALDWDRHLGHISIIYDMLLPYLLTGGALDDDDIGILESGNGIPDIIDEARDEVDFFLRLRHEGGYSQGLSNPDTRTNILYQAGNTPLAAWANAVNAAILAEAFRVSGHDELMDEYIEHSLEAFHYADALEDPWLERRQNIGEGFISGRDLKATAAAFLYNLTGEERWETVFVENCVITTPETPVLRYISGNPGDSHNQLYAAVAYLTSPRAINHPVLRDRLRAAILNDARAQETRHAETRPSRRTTDDATGWFQTVQNVHRTIAAHAFARDAADRDAFLNALLLEADWGLGRNPLNIIQMTTATTPLERHRSVVNIYTSGRNDGTPGLHPGHTPYLNLGPWGTHRVMGNPLKLHEESHPYPDDYRAWPMAELYYSTRFVYAHSEFTPQQTMRGKAALYGYLYGLARMD
ncbi:MAG: glycosyl hydrolase family 5 [Puniceicoccaceae bacterium]|nr:MAG: glycosyl hydrolase family 5 [Puniceicoccaceae bacterium]